jgi:L-ascorbate metabolism protein UlaG (beta-lactamase superfamily)
MKSFFLALIMGSSAACATTAYPKTDHFDGDQFFIEGAPPVKGFFELLKWQLGGDKTPWPKWIDDNETPQVKSTVDANEVWITHINHASHLIQIKSLNILTDPIFSERASPMSFAGPKRIRAPGIQLENLPKIDVVLISHNHYDHFDLDSIRELEKKFNPLFLVPLGNAELLKKAGASKIQELDWWESKNLNPEIGQITLVPVHHWSARGFFDRNKALWGGFVIKNANLQIYFSGDTGYGRFFKETFEKLGPMDVALIAIGAYAPRWFMRDQHVNPEEAVLIHQELKAKLSIGSHFGTFPLTDEGYDQPVIDLAKALEAKGLTEKDFMAPKNGQTIHYSK